MKSHKILFFIIILLFVTGGLWGCKSNISLPKENTFSVESSYLQESGEHLSINAEYPVLKGFPGADVLNSEIKGKVLAAAEEVGNAADEMENRDGFSATLNSSYGYFNNDDLSSLWMLWDNYTGGAHGLYWIDSYNLNTSTGDIYFFPDIFQDAEMGIEYITARILKEVQDPEKGFFDSASETVKNYHGNYNFIINGDQLIVYFPLYDIAPYVAGIQHFDFTARELESMLKPEISQTMLDQPVQNILYL